MGVRWERSPSQLLLLGEMPPFLESFGCGQHCPAYVVRNILPPFLSPHTALQWPFLPHPEALPDCSYHSPQPDTSHPLFPHSILLLPPLGQSLT